jgi:hypothetical protein
MPIRPVFPHLCLFRIACQHLSHSTQAPMLGATSAYMLSMCLCGLNRHGGLPNAAYPISVFWSGIPPDIALPVRHVVAQHQTVASRQNESLFGDGAPGALPSGAPKVTSFDCRLISAWCWHAIINQQSPNGEKGTIP